MIRSQTIGRKSVRIILENARVAELVYAHDLKSCLARDVGSIPTSGTRDFEKFN